MLALACASAALVVDPTLVLISQSHVSAPPSHAARYRDARIVECTMLEDLLASCSTAVQMPRGSTIRFDSHCSTVESTGIGIGLGTLIARTASESTIRGQRRKLAVLGLPTNVRHASGWRRPTQRRRRSAVRVHRSTVDCPNSKRSSESDRCRRTYAKCAYGSTALLNQSFAALRSFTLAACRASALGLHGELGVGFARRKVT